VPVRGKARQGHTQTSDGGAGEAGGRERRAFVRAKTGTGLVLRDAEGQGRRLRRARGGAKSTKDD